MSIAARTAVGAAWHLGSALGIRAIGLVATLVLTRFLAPEEYGEVLLAAACLAIVARSATLGAPTYVLTHETSPAEAFQAAAAQLVLSAVGVGLLCAVGEPLGRALGAPGMYRYLPGLGLAVVIAQLASVPAATLNRELRFRLPATARMAGEAAYAALAVLTVPFLGAMAVVAGNVGRSVLASALILSGARRTSWWHPVWPSAAVLKKQAAFGTPLMGSNIAQTLSEHGDNLIVSRLHGPAAMGFYNLGFKVATSPTAYLADYAGDVMLAGLAAVPEEERRRQAFLRALSVVALLVLPLAFGLAVTAPTLVSVFLDARWAPIAPMITILSAIAAARVVGSVANPYLLTERHSRTILFLSWLRASTLLCLLLTLGRLDPLWACASAAFAAVVANLGSLGAVVRQQGVRPWLFARALAPPLAASLVMVLVVTVLRELVDGSWPGFLRLACEVAFGALSYLAISLLVARAHLSELIRVLRDLPVFRRSSPAGE